MADTERIIGMKKGTVMLAEHNDRWHDIAGDTMDGLRGVLGGAAVDIQHIGSTSVYGICAKPIIDIVIGLKNLDDILKEEVLDALAEYGFLRDEEHDNRAKIFFYKGEGDIITHHVHAVVHGEDAWNSYTKMRDYLNKNPDEAKIYGDLKLESMKNCDNDISKYHDGKAEFLKQINQIVL